MARAASNWPKKRAEHPCGNWAYAYYTALNGTFSVAHRDWVYHIRSMLSSAFPYIIFVVVSVALRPFYEHAHIFAFALPDSPAARQVGCRLVPGTMGLRLFVCVCRFHNAAIMRVINLGPGLLMQPPLAIPLGQLSTRRHWPTFN